LLGRLVQGGLESQSRDKPAGPHLKEQNKFGRSPGRGGWMSVTDWLGWRRPVPPAQFVPQVVEQIGCEIASGSEGPYRTPAEV
jgi:hypothetical protein